MANGNDVTITGDEYGDYMTLKQPGRDPLIIPKRSVAALRAHFAAERMPEDVQTLVDEADRLLSYSRADKGVRVLIGRLAAALKAAYSQKAESEWEYGVRDYRSPGDGVWVVGPTWDASLREYYGERPLVRRRKAGEWEPVEDEVANGGE